jgi:hypothetical protein
MKRLTILALFLFTACAGNFLTQVRTVAANDVRDAVAINSDPAVPDPVGRQCVAWIQTAQPDIERVLSYPTSGVLSVIAKRRAIENLRVKLRPEFEVACAPVLMDERQRLIRFAALFGK